MTVIIKMVSNGVMWDGVGWGNRLGGIDDNTATILSPSPNTISSSPSPLRSVYRVVAVDGCSYFYSRL